jgi:hypothetical protein
MALKSIQEGLFEPGDLLLHRPVDMVVNIMASMIYVQGMVVESNVRLLTPAVLLVLLSIL